MSKIIAQRLKGKLSDTISKEQFCFLKGRSIHDAAAVTQEALFAIHSKKSEAVLLKVDLRKAYDCIDWAYIKCLLAKIGLNINMIRWIMACIDTVDYAIIINGLPTSFFRAEWGLRQGCALSPLLFILAINSLSLHIHKAVDENVWRPLHIYRNISLSHNLFVDDILLFAMFCRATWLHIHMILNNFQRASGLQVNLEKSSIIHSDIKLEDVTWLSDLFGVKASHISKGINYLGFWIKATGYSRVDWSWLVDRFYRRISGWEFRCLSLAGRIVLVQSILNQLFVYWAHLFHLPASIINSMNSISANFIWGGRAEKHKYHLVKHKWHLIS